MLDAECLVIGSGVAGMWFALQAAEHTSVTMITKASTDDSNSRYAQGGIAAVWHDDDSHEDHVRDTLLAGAGLCRRDAVELTVRLGPQRVRDLIERGAEFTFRETHPDEYDLHREGGHSFRRILHAHDMTGAEIVRTLASACAAHPKIRMLDHHMAVDLITLRGEARRGGAIGPPEGDDRVVGAYVLDTLTNEVSALACGACVLATGGAGKVYQFTTNPQVATGDGMAMGYRAGARIANMEFVQFHPTCLFHPKQKSFLVSEALRGEGGKLRLPTTGERFMERYDDRAELAPRDVVARAIDSEIKRGGLECVHLDMTHLPSDELQRKFPAIYAQLAEVGIDMAAEPIPVVPAAHYFCGGVSTNLHGQSSIPNLYAVGETACTGLHGANRLASNSLLEALVFSHRAADHLAGVRDELPKPGPLHAWEAGSATDSDELVVIRQVWRELRTFMWNYVGIVRSHRRLKRARRRIALVQEEINTYYWDFKVTGDLIELRNLACVAELVVRCALMRHESRGLHYTIDFPETDDRFIMDTVVQRPEF